MYSCKLGSLALLLALAASHHFILLHCQEPDIEPPSPPTDSNYSSPPPPPPTDLNYSSPPLRLLRSETFPANKSEYWGPLQTSGHTPTALIAGAVIGSVVLIVGLFACFFMWRKRRTRQSAQPPKADEEVAPSSPPKGLSLGPTTFEGVVPSYLRKGLSLGPTTFEGVAPSSLRKSLSLGPTAFTYEELESATNGFSDSNFLGEGGVGTVHKGVLPGEQIYVAVKQLKLGIQEATKEFLTEITVINRIHHKHLVSLIGYCIDEARSKMMLVSDFVPNKTLAFHLRGTGTIDWKKRMKIAIGSAKGLAYLHEECQPKIIHRDIKATNNLVDKKFEPKARRLFPEALDKGRLEGLVDSRLKNDYNVDEMFRMISCAANCVRHSAPSRPRMTQVVQALEGAIQPKNDMTEETWHQPSEEMNKMAFRSSSTTHSSS